MALQWPRTRNTEPEDLKEGLPCALFSDSQILGKSCQGFGPWFPQLMWWGGAFIHLLPYSSWWGKEGLCKRLEENLLT